MSALDRVPVVRSLGARRRLVLGVSLVLVVASGALTIGGAPHVAAFVASALALAGVAWIVATAVDAIGGHASAGLTGVLQATMANLPEFFVVLFALHARDRVVAETSLLGSIFANSLLVLGVVIVVGARVGEGVMRFRTRLPRDTATLLLLAVFLIAVLGLSTSLGQRAGRHPEAISIVGALCLVAVYGTWLPRYLRESEAATARDECPAMRLPAAVGMLVVGGIAAALVSDWFVHDLEPSLVTLHLSKTFAGLVVAAIAGNAAENLASVVQAAKGRSDLALALVENSVSQVALVLYPLAVVVSLLFPAHLTFVVNPVFIGALVLTALVLWQITGDGQAYAFEGAALVSIYAILALVAFYD